MGVHGLWKLIESAGKPVPVETLENKVLAVGILFIRRSGLSIIKMTLSLWCAECCRLDPVSELTISGSNFTFVSDNPVNES